MATKAGPPAAALKKFREKFGKSFGEDTLKTFGPDFKYDVIPTGSIALDYALGCGGWIKGRIFELWGPEQLGKSTEMLVSIAEAQRLSPDKMQGWIDVEKTWDPRWAELHGVDLDRVLLAQPDSAEDVADMAKEMVTSGLIDMLTLDSIGAMISRAEKEKDAGEATVAIVAKIVTRMTKLMAAEAPRYGVAVGVINQVRANISASGPRASQITRPGGFGLGHVTTHRCKVRRGADTYRIGKKGDGYNYEVQVGQQVAFEVEKNKVAPPKRTAMMTFFNQATKEYGPVGIDKAYDAYSMGIQLDVITSRAGGYYTLPDGFEIRSKEAVLQHLRANPEARDQVRKGVLATVAGEVVEHPMEEG
jgi:recombination protein RecA